MLDWDIVLKDKVLIQCKSFNRDNVLRLIFSIQRDKIPSESFKNNKDNVLIQNYPKYQDKVISVLSLSQISAHWDLILIQNYTMHPDNQFQLDLIIKHFVNMIKNYIIGQNLYLSSIPSSGSYITFCQFNLSFNFRR